MSTKLAALRLGVRDGLAAPYDLGMGVTYVDDAELSEVYDRGANIGQAVARVGLALAALSTRVRDAARVLRTAGMRSPEVGP